MSRPRLSSAVWLAAWTALAAWLSYGLATAWPYVGAAAQAGLLLAMPGVLFRSFDLLWMWRRRVPVAGARRWLARGVAIVAGVAAAAGLARVFDAASMARFESAMAPVVARLAANAAAPCAPAARPAAGAALDDYLQSAGRARPGGVLHHGGPRFVLAFPGGSADIDGSTVWYDSAAPGWRKFHNDAAASAAAFAALVKGMDSCKITLR